MKIIYVFLYIHVYVYVSSWEEKQPMFSDVFMQFDGSTSDDTTKCGVLMLSFLSKVNFKDKVGVRAKSFI